MYKYFRALIAPNVNLTVDTTAGCVLNVLVRAESCSETTGSN